MANMADFLSRRAVQDRAKIGDNHIKWRSWLLTRRIEKDFCDRHLIVG